MGKIPYEKQNLENLCKESFSYNEVLVKAGKSKGGSNIAVLKKYIELYNIDISHFTNSTSPKKIFKPHINNKKICQQCGIEKDTYKDYYWSNGHTRNICKECVKENERKKYTKRQEEFMLFKSNFSCKKCGEKRPYLLDFHHKDPNEKDFAISDKPRINLNKIQEEINKCDVLCANCHREWHYLYSHNIIQNYDDWLKTK